MLELNTLLTPAILPAIAVITAIGIGCALVKEPATKDSLQSKSSMASIKLNILVSHPRKFILINNRMVDLKTLVDMISEIDLVPMCEDKRVSLAMVADIFVCGSLSHKSFLHFIKAQSTDMVLRGIEAKERLLLDMLVDVDKERLSNNLLVQGFDMIDDGRFIENKQQRKEVLARGERWLNYGHHINKLVRW